MSATGSALTRVVRSTSIVLVAVLPSLVIAAAVGGQGLPNNAVSIDRGVIGCQVRQAIVLGERARNGLESPTAADDIDASHKLLDTMYRQVRRALGNLNDRKSRAQVPDPMLDLEVAKVRLAWNTIRGPVDAFFNSPGKDEWRADAARDLRVAMSALRQAEAMLPWCANSRRPSEQESDS
jgi:hypothetical protein